MSKKLTPLEALIMLQPLFVKYPLFQENYDIIKTALIELEDLRMFNTVFCLYYKNHEDIKKHFKKLEKELKALEIIKDKNGDVDFFKYCCQEFNDEVGLEQYNIRHVECSNNGKPLNKEEFDLLKEVLL